MMEVELKFQVPDDQAAHLRAAIESLSPARAPFEARYFDTVDGVLARNAISLRLRKEGDAWVQTLKVGGSGSVAREEHNAAVGLADDSPPTLDIERHAGCPAHRRLLAVVGDPTQLAEVFCTTVERLTLQLESSSGHVELALDTGKIVADDASAPVHELEFELKRGATAELFDVALPWVQQFGLWLDVQSKSDRGQLLLRGQKHSGPRGARPPSTVCPEPREFVRATVEACMDQILHNASEVADGSENPDHVHQLRVGLRRLRTALRELPQLNAGLDPTWEPVLANAFRELGKHRDAAILKSGTVVSLAAAGAPGLPPPNNTAESPSLSPAGLASAWEMQRTLLAVLEFTLEAPGPDQVAFEGDAIAAVATRLDRLQRQIAKSAKRFLQMPADKQHEVRKQLKRLRYLAEFLAPAFPKKAVTAYFKDMKPAQDALGEHNDEATALAYFRDATRQDAKAWFAVGWLTARQEISARVAAKALRKSAKAKPFWLAKRSGRTGSALAE